MTVCVVAQQGDLAVVPKRTICIDEIVDFLSANHYSDRNQSLSAHWTARWLKPVSSHVWFLDENHERVFEYREAALATIAAARQGDPWSAAAQTVEFLASAILNRYGHDRASYVSARLPDHPALETIQDLPRQVHYENRVVNLTFYDLRYSRNSTVEIADRVAEVSKLAVPDKFFELGQKVEYLPAIPYAPTIYAQYSEWLIQIAEYK